MHVDSLRPIGYLDRPPEGGKPTRDEILDAYDVLFRAGAKQLRPMLDSVYESGYVEGLKAGRSLEAKEAANRISMGSAAAFSAMAGNRV